MIPKVIHYCWFGRNPLPESAVKCIESWRKYMPGYEIKEWNEDNFDVNMVPYIAEAYSVKKYAFVSDYARFWILYHYGGVYFDTDVEVIKPLDDIVEKGPFMGVEEFCKMLPEDLIDYPFVAPGLGIAATPGMDVYKQMLDYYDSVHFMNKEGQMITGGTVVVHTTRILVKAGLKKFEDSQQVAGIQIYPADYFNPFEDITGRLRITDRTRSIHWYASSWKPRNPVRQWLSRMSHRIFGLWLHKLIMMLKGQK